MVIQNNNFAFTASNLTEYITVKGGTGNTGVNTSIFLPQPTTDLNGMKITIRKYQNIGIVNIYIYQTTGNSNLSILILNNSVSGVNTMTLNSTTSTAIFYIMDGYYYQII